MRELRAGADAELAIDTRQRCLHGVLGEEEGCRNLAVGAALGDESRDPLLGLCQLAARGRTAADARQLGARLLGPERRAEPLEACERVLERRAGGAALLRAPLRPAEGEQRPRVVERIRAASVLGERALEARERALEIAARGEQEPAAPREDRKRPGSVERVGALLPRRENLAGLVELARLRSGFEEIA